MKASQTPATPVKQAMVNIAGHVILAVLFADNSIGAAFHMICDLIGVDRRGQMRKVQADRAIYDSLILTTVKTAGGPQETYVIIAEAIPVWLAHIHESKVAPEARETLIEFQRVAVDTLRAFFFPETREQPQSPPLKQEPEAAPIPPPQEPPLSGLEYLHVGIESIGQKEIEQDARLKHHDAHLGRHDTEIETIFEEVYRMGEQITDIESTGPLAFAHQVEMRTRLKALEHQSGQSRGALERELAATFGVRVIEQLPEAFWGRIVEWFQQRLGW